MALPRRRSSQAIERRTEARPIQPRMWKRAEGSPSVRFRRGFPRALSAPLPGRASHAAGRRAAAFQQVPEWTATGEPPGQSSVHHLSPLDRPLAPPLPPWPLPVGSRPEPRGNRHRSKPMPTGWTRFPDRYILQLRRRPAFPDMQRAAVLAESEAPEWESPSRHCFCRLVAIPGIPDFSKCWRNGSVPPSVPCSRLEHRAGFDLFQTGPSPSKWLGNPGISELDPHLLRSPAAWMRSPQSRRPA